MIQCPKCKATREDVRLVYLMEAVHNVTSESPGELVVDGGHNVEPEAGATPGLLCDECDTRWPLPKGVTVVAVKNGKRVTIFGPDGRSR